MKQGVLEIELRGDGILNDHHDPTRVLVGGADMQSALKGRFAILLLAHS